MNKLLALSLLGVLASPFVSSAATYHYVDLTGTVHDIEAPTALQAFATVENSGQTIHSGVAPDLGIIRAGQNYGVDYSYVTNQGTVATVHAASLDAASALATDRAPNSGFLVGELK
jgi:hypothetical protein